MKDFQCHSILVNRRWLTDTIYLDIILGKLAARINMTNKTSNIQCQHLIADDAAKMCGDGKCQGDTWHVLQTWPGGGAGSVGAADGWTGTASPHTAPPLKTLHTTAPLELSTISWTFHIICIQIQRSLLTFLKVSDSALVKTKCWKDHKTW